QHNPGYVAYRGSSLSFSGLDNGKVYDFVAAASSTGNHGDMDYSVTNGTGATNASVPTAIGFNYDPGMTSKYADDLVAFTGISPVGGVIDIQLLSIGDSGAEPGGGNTSLDLSVCAFVLGERCDNGGSDGSDGTDGAGSCGSGYTVYTNDRDPGFYAPADWTLGSPSNSYNTETTSSRLSNDASGEAVWTFVGLDPGDYEVSVTWSEGAGNTTNAEYEVFDDLVSTGPAFAVDQKVAPVANYTQFGRPFEVLGTATITGSKLIVKLPNTTSVLSSQWIVADAVRIECNGTGGSTDGTDGTDGSDGTDGVTYCSGDVIIADDEDGAGANFSMTNAVAWQTYGGGSKHLASAVRSKFDADGASEAVWTFSGLDPGDWEVSVSWNGGSGRNSTAYYKIFDNLAQRGSYFIDQTIEPTTSYTEGGRPFQTLDTVTI
ncbi:MAG: hypothetical protein N2C12_03185, partial [Planctomycetales bacterium]